MAIAKRICSLLCLCAALSAQAAIELVSVPAIPSATSAADSTAPLFTDDGKTLLFLSSSADLIVMPPALPAVNIYLRQLDTGAIKLISAAPAGQASNGDSAYPASSPTGAFVAFQSSASNLVFNDTNGVPDIFVRDVAVGATELVSIAADGGAANGGSFHPSISADGRFVVFESLATNLGPADTNATFDIYLRDRQTKQTVRVSDGPDASAKNTSLDATISPDGQFVAFASIGPNFETGVNMTAIYLYSVAGKTNHYLPLANGAMLGTNATFSANNAYVFYQDSSRRVYRVNLLTLASSSTALTITSGYTISADGRYAFFSTSSAPTAGFVRYDFETQTRELVNLDPNTGSAAGGAFGRTQPATSADGQRALFITASTTLVPGKSDGTYRWYWRDMAAPVSQLVLESASGSDDLRGSFPSISPDGLTFALEAGPLALMSDDLNEAQDIFQVKAGAVAIASSRATTSTNTAGASLLNDISADGRFVLFTSRAANIVADDTNHASDVFLRDLSAGTTTLVSAGLNGEVGSANSYRGKLSGNGRVATFVSSATNLVAGDTNHADLIFVRNLQSGETRRVTDGRLYAVKGLDDEGRYVLIENQYSPFNVFVYDWQSGTITNIRSGGFSSAISRDGRSVVFRTMTAIGMFDLPSQTLTNITAMAPMFRASVSFSPDSRWLLIASNRVLYARSQSSGEFIQLFKNVNAAAASADAAFIAMQVTNTPSKTVLLNRATGQTNLLFAGADSAVTEVASGIRITSDGRFVQFRGRAVTNEPAAVYLYDRMSGQTARLSTAANLEIQTALLASDAPVSAFQSFSTDVVANDGNNASDVFVWRDETPMLAIVVEGQSATLRWNTIAG